MQKINIKHQPIYIVFSYVLCLLFPCLVQAQHTGDTSAPRIRNIIYTTPVSKNTVINGLAIGFAPVTWRGANTLSINGVSVSASPVDPFIGMAVLFFSIDRHKGDSAHPRETLGAKNYLIKKTDTIKSVYNGLIIGSISAGARTNGVNISVILNSSYSMNGISIAGLHNFHYSFNGILIAGLRNKTTTGRGLQIGLFNRCNEGKLVQIGLINRIGKRTIPFINFQF
jgi:hypothetical protein